MFGVVRKLFDEDQSISRTFFMFCKCSSCLATIFDDKFHIGQCSTLFGNCLMKIKAFLELFSCSANVRHVWPPFSMINFILGNVRRCSEIV